MNDNFLVPSSVLKCSSVLTCPDDAELRKLLPNIWKMPSHTSTVVNVVCITTFECRARSSNDVFSAELELDDFRSLRADLRLVAVSRY